MVDMVGSSAMFIAFLLNPILNVGGYNLLLADGTKKQEKSDDGVFYKVNLVIENLFVGQNQITVEGSFEKVQDNRSDQNKMANLFTTPANITNNQKKEKEKLTRGSPKRYFMTTKSKKKQKKIKSDAAEHNGKIVHEFIDLGITVVSFPNTSDASSFASALECSEEGITLEEDAPRFSMSMLRSSSRSQPTLRGLRASSAMNSTNLSTNVSLVDAADSINILSEMDFTSQAIPEGISKIFNGTLPHSSYYPSKIAKKKICIVDSGFDTKHPDLLNINVTAGDAAPFEPHDICAHGTSVTGIIVGEDNSIGIIGMFPGASVMVVPVFSGNNCDWVYSSDLISAVKKCESYGANIISLSLSGLISTTAEKLAFKSLKEKGILTFAAAGNYGNNEFRYPASYSSVISVAALDNVNNRAEFSNYNNQVDISAPGMDVLTTHIASEDVFFVSTTSGGVGYAIIIFQYSVMPSMNITSTACQCNLTSCPDQCNSRICLIPRGTVIFAEKAIACATKGGIAAIIYNNQGGFCNGTLSSIGVVSIPVFCTSDVYGVAMANVKPGTNFTINAEAQPYTLEQGTSFAVPHVAGAAFLLWNKFPSCNSTEIYNAVMLTAFDLGPEGRDDSFGQGLIQYWPAANYLARQSCGKKRNFSSPIPSTLPIQLPPLSRPFIQKPAKNPYVQGVLPSLKKPPTRPVPSPTIFKASSMNNPMQGIVPSLKKPSPPRISVPILVPFPTLQKSSSTNPPTQRTLSPLKKPSLSTPQVRIPVPSSTTNKVQGMVPAQKKPLKPSIQEPFTLPIKTIPSSGIVPLLKHPSSAISLPKPPAVIPSVKSTLPSLKDQYPSPTIQIKNLPAKPFVQGFLPILARPSPLKTILKPTTVNLNITPTLKTTPSATRNTTNVDSSPAKLPLYRATIPVKPVPLARIPAIRPSIKGTPSAPRKKPYPLNVTSPNRISPRNLTSPARPSSHKFPSPK